MRLGFGLKLIDNVPDEYRLDMPPSHVQYYGPQFQGRNDQPMQASFQYSMCTGKKKALCVSLFGPRYRLLGR
jgi:hypothetical protein